MKDKLNRREFLKQLSMGTAALGISMGVGGALVSQAIAASKTKSTKKLPNVILILTDDMGWGDLSCYPQSKSEPDAWIKTPNIDKLAAEGAKCMQAYATCTICTPSRAGLLTGRYQERFGWYEFKEALAGIPKDELMMQEYMKSMGYATALIGKWHLGYKPELGPLTRQFDRFYGFMGGQHDYFDPRLGDPIMAMSFDYDANVMDQTTPVTKMEYLTDELTDKSIEFITQQVKAKNPFFLYLPYSTPHPSMQATWKKLEPYAKARGGKFNTRDITRAMIDSLDEDIGKLMNCLKELGIDDNTLIVFTSDNGGADDRGEGQAVVQHNGGLRPRKGFFWEGGIRVPMIVRWPGHVPKGVIYDKPVTHLDIFATMVAATGAAKAPKTLDGVNLLPYLAKKNKGTPHETLYWAFDPVTNRWAVRHGKWKLTNDVVSPISQYEGKNTMVLELHDLESDPEERIDLKDKYPEIVQQLTKLKDEFYQTCKPTIATEQMMQDWRKELDERKKKLPEADRLRKDGAPGHWL